MLTAAAVPGDQVFPLGVEEQAPEFNRTKRTVGMIALSTGLGVCITAAVIVGLSAIAAATAGIVKGIAFAIFALGGAGIGLYCILSEKPHRIRDLCISLAIGVSVPGLIAVALAVIAVGTAIGLIGLGYFGQFL